MKKISQHITEKMLLKEANKQGLLALKKAIGKEKSVKELINETVINEEKETEKIIDESPETKNEVSEATNETTGTSKENSVQSEVNENLLQTENKEHTEILEKKISIWDDIKKPTNEDSHISESLKNIASDAVNTETRDENQDEKEAIKAKASIVVELIDTGFMLVCVFISWDFSSENQKFYTLNPDRKKAIKINLEKIYAMSKKEQNPKKTIIWLILGSYAPLLILAIFALFNRLKEGKKKTEQETINQLQAKVNEYEMRNSQTVNEVIETKTEEKQNPNLRPEKKISKGKKGRHKLSCPKSKNKNANCNCK